MSGKMQNPFCYSVDSLQKNWDERERPTCLDKKTVLLMDEKEIDEAVEKEQKMMAKAFALTHEERMNICDMGFYNDVIKGYLIVAMRNKGFKREEIERALNGLEWALDDTTADEAAAVHRKF